jgi:hypothetical protein
LQDIPAKELSIRVFTAADVAASSAIFWNRMEGRDAGVTSIARDIGLVLADLLGALVGGAIGAAIFSIAFLVIWWLIDNG